MEDNFLLKDMFNQDSVGALAEAFSAVYPAFKVKTFITGVFGTDWDSLELKERVRRITLSLAEELPDEYTAALEILQAALPRVEDQGFEKMVFPDFIEVFGLEDAENSMAAIEFVTQHVSAEFAIRHFIIRYPDLTLAQMFKWADHPHPGVRRLACEGCRPRLPWGIRLHQLVEDPAPVLPILEKLKDDPREEIRRSVANNLNDISKDHPDMVVNILKEWDDPENNDRSRLIKHAIRTLIKAGHPGALELLGFSSSPQIKIVNISLEPDQIQLGENAIFSFEIISTGGQEQQLMVDYVIHFMKANGAQAPKVYKLKQLVIQPGEQITITKKHGIKPLTTRKYHPGIQTFQPQINGVRYGKIDLLLNVK